MTERETAKKVDTVFATYAIDPKTSGEEPRAILINSDVIKINIEDKGRDKRTGKIYAVGVDNIAPNTLTVPTELITALQGALSADELEDLLGEADVRVIQLSSLAYFTRVQGIGPELDNGIIGTSGDAQFRLTGGPDSTKFPMAPDGKVFWFGTAVATGASTDLLIKDLSTEFIGLDEDFNPGTRDSVAPWMRVSAAVPADIDLNVRYIYYQTSELEELVGGLKKANYEGYDDDPLTIGINETGGCN